MTPAGQDSDRVQALAAAAVAPYGMLVDGVEVVSAGTRRIVRITLDRDLATLPPDDHVSPVPPLDLDAVADASRAVDKAFERESTALFGDRPYLLEVGSAGAERRLTLPRHYRANVGRLAYLTLTDGSALLARIVAAGPDEVTVRPDPEAGDGPRGGSAGGPGGGRRGAGKGGRLTQPAAGVPLPDRVLPYGAVASARTRVEFAPTWQEPADPPPGDEPALDGLAETGAIDESVGAPDEFTGAADPRE